MTSPRVNAHAAWAALNTALQDYAPPCAGLDVFTADRLTPGDLEACASICARCPVRAPCADYATAAHVTAGVWAGRSYTPRTPHRAAPGNHPKGTNE